MSSQAQYMVVSPIDLPFFCSKCASPRPGEICWKCEEPTRIPHASWDNPGVPPIDTIRELGREVGYVITPHGSLQRDLDLVACPWTEEAVSAQELIEHLNAHLGTNVRGRNEQRAWGRLAVTLQMDGWYKPIDLSIMARSGT